MPCRVVTSPEACSREIASRTTVRLTPCCFTISDSGGSFSPGASAPVPIKLDRRATTSWVRFRDGFLPLGSEGFIRSHLLYDIIWLCVYIMAANFHFNKDCATYDILCQEVFWPCAKAWLRSVHYRFTPPPCNANRRLTYARLARNLGPQHF